MSVFRPIAFVLAILGYVLGGITIYLGFNPVQFPTQEKLTVTQILNCQSTKETYEYSSFSDEKVKSLTNILGETSPVQIVKDLAGTIDSAAKTGGSKTFINIEYCNVSTTISETLDKVNSNLKSKEKYYEYGTIEKFVNDFNQLPFAKLTNINVDVQSTFARTKVCNKPVNKSEFYIFTVAGSNASSQTQVALFDIELKSNTSASMTDKFIGNLITSGHYFKANYSCNG